ncbi:MAG TPA: aminoglycoside phosphotransferase family protein [Rectinemataceae bacterium]|nr:aminoglycoside phosphotransferase family protein [Rectinemataceae bacterium]
MTEDQSIATAPNVAAAQFAPQPLAGLASPAGPASPADIVGEFSIAGVCEEIRPFGGGHINDTFLSSWRDGGGIARYIHQRVNDKVFRRPDEVMENILRVTSHIRGELSASGVDDVERRTLTVLPARSGLPWFRDAEGGWWRTYRFIERTHSRDCVASAEQAAMLGAAIGDFQAMLADMPPPRLRETIPAFHDMEKRYERFDEAAAADVRGRAAAAAPEILFMAENRNRGGALARAMRAGLLPARICHNDAKLNNILLDDDTSEALCVVDLDTVMPGTVLFDFGDLVRTVASTAPEDETDLSRVGFSLELFRALLAGYLSKAGAFLVPAEKELLGEAGRSLAQIMGLRFLTDFLEGDVYYKISRPSHNLDRCRNQIAFIRSMDAASGDIGRVTKEELSKY